jgi:hypothetical protein
MMTRAGRARARRGAGFSFTEVLFAVMVLGIGFIMIAAMFPVVIGQTQTTLAETNGALLGRAGLAYLQSVATEQTFKQTGTGANPPVKAMTFADDPAKGTGTFAVRGNYVSSANGRFAWVPLYRRGTDADGTKWPYAQVFMVPVQARVRSQFVSTVAAGPTVTDLDRPANYMTKGIPANLDARLVKVTVKLGAMDAGVRAPGQITITAAPDFDATGAVASGAYVILADAGKGTGRVYQLATEVSPGTWTMSAGADMNDEDAELSRPVDAFIVGRGYAVGEAPGGAFGGASQDVGIYVGFIQIPSGAEATP